MKILQLDKIPETRMQDRLWSFYQDQFAELNAETPLSQTLARSHFSSWLKSSRAKKFIITDDRGEITGFAIISSELRHDPLISIPYFKKHFCNKKVFHFPVIAIAREFALENPRAHSDLMQDMMATIPADGVAIFFHSEIENPLMPRLVRKSCAPKIGTTKLDAMRCVLLEWRPSHGNEPSAGRHNLYKNHGTAFASKQPQPLK
jgi:hypothetical protein